MLAWAPPHHLSLSSVNFPCVFLGVVIATCAQGHPGTPTFPVGLAVQSDTRAPKENAGPVTTPTPSPVTITDTGLPHRGHLLVCSAGSSSSELKEITMSFFLAFSDGQEKKVSTFPFSLSALPQHLPSEPHVPQSAPMKKSRSPSF